jgi:hypothetical protein
MLIRGLDSSDLSQTNVIMTSTSATYSVVSIFLCLFSEEGSFESSRSLFADSLSLGEGDSSCMLNNYIALSPCFFQDVK